MTDSNELGRDRRALLFTALGGVLLEPWQSVRELVMLHAWSGLGAIVVGLTLTHDKNR